MPDTATREHILSTLIGVICDIQRNAGRDVPRITEDTVPFDHVAGFDSVCGVEAAVLVSERIGVEIEQIPFVSAKDGHHQTVCGIVDAMMASHGQRIVSGVRPAASAASPAEPSQR